MIDALSCKICNMIGIDEYCTKNIEPLLLKSNGQPIYFGKYNSNGTINYYISKIYAKDPPQLYSVGRPEVSPIDIKNYLESLGYNVSLVQVSEKYEAGYSSSKKTRYYNAGYNTYYSLKISC